MVKLKALLIGLLPILLVVAGGVYFYSHFPTTPALILLLLFAFSAVLIGITMYNHSLEKESTKDIPLFEWITIEIEGNLLPIFPDEFFANPQVSDGTLHCFGEQVGPDNMRYLSGKINKLTSESVFEFSNGYSILAKDLHLVHVGDFQFSVSSFDSLQIKKNSQVLQTLKKRGNLITIIHESEEKTYKIETNTPLFVFLLKIED